jgi:ATP-dependent exoDNAse (exonuclease V) beta subunit
MAKLFDFAQAVLQFEPPETLPPDHREREQALDITQSWIVEAPAGSGKTGLLIQRYLKLLTDEQVSQPEQVLAITFTEKATSEIRERVVAQLEAANGPDTSKSQFDRTTRALAQAVLERDTAMGWGLVERPRRLNVRTIDSICAEIARTLPVLSGAGGVQVPVTEPATLYHEAAGRTLQQLGGTDAALSAALRTVLLHRDGNLGDVERLIAEMLQWRDQWGGLIPLRGEELSDDYLDRVVREKLERTLRRIVSRGLAELSARIPADFLSDLAALASRLAELEPYGCSVSPIAVCRGQGVPGIDAHELQHWRALIHLLVSPSRRSWRRSFAKNHLGFDLSREHRRRLEELRERIENRDDVLEVMRRVNHLPPLHYPEDQWVVAKALFRVLSRALAELQIVFAEKGECDFAEFGLLARTALKSDDGVAAFETALGMRFRHLLIDEMQDTSTSQYELVELLTQGWHGGGQTVFLVGDPKQSIYLFRQARVERFVETMRTRSLGELPLGCLRLTANFRSQSRLIDAFNEDFSLLFPADHATRPEDIPFVRASAIRGPAGSQVRDVVWHAEALLAGLQGDALRTERRRRGEQEAQEIRSILREWRDRPLPEGRTKPWRMAVLVQSRNHLTRIVAALKEDAEVGPIPFRAVEIEELSERPEILDLFALTRALLHPADRVAWLAVLRAPWCGLSLADLHMLAGGDDPKWQTRSMEESIAERGQELSEESCQRLMRVWEVVQAAMKQRARLTLAQLVERTWRSLGGDAYLAETETINARHYFELLDRLEDEAGVVDTVVLKDRLSKLYAEPEMHEDAVDLMTIHKSKGLEWDVVIVPGLERPPNVNTSRLLNWGEVNSEEESAHVLLAPIQSKGGESGELNKWLKGVQSAREAAERRRLFYVACTRAQEELHLFAAPKASSGGSIQTQPNSLLRAAWPAAQQHFGLQGQMSLPGVEPSPLEDDEIYVGEMAAARVSEAPVLIERLPLDFDPKTRFQPATRFMYEEASAAEPSLDFRRPEGSLEARALGNVIHAFLEVLARQIQEGARPERLLEDVEGWDGRIRAVLRGEGLAPAKIAQLQSHVKTALKNTLRDADGLWVLAAHEDAASEYGLTTWEKRARSVRLDRIFLAGNKPQAEGRDCLWIVDYKTTAHGPQGVGRFLEEERKKYGPQMETYARMMQVSSGREELRLGLYYPMLAKLIWWQFDSGSGNDDR